MLLSYLKPSKECQVSLMPALARVHIFQNDSLLVRVCLDMPFAILGPTESRNMSLNPESAFSSDENLRKVNFPSSHLVNAWLL